MKTLLLIFCIPVLLIGCAKKDYNDLEDLRFNDAADFRLSFDYHEEWGTIRELPFEFNSMNYNMAEYGHVHNDVMNQLTDVLMEIDYCDLEEMSNYIKAIDSIKALNNLNAFDTWVIENGLDQYFCFTEEDSVSSQDFIDGFVNLYFDQFHENANLTNYEMNLLGVLISEITTDPYNVDFESKYIEFYNTYDSDSLLYEGAFTLLSYVIAENSLAFWEIFVKDELGEHFDPNDENVAAIIIGVAAVDLVGGTSYWLGYHIEHQGTPSFDISDAESAALTGAIDGSTLGLSAIGRGIWNRFLSD